MTSLPWIPSFVYGSTRLDLTYPVTRWVPGVRTIGSARTTASGVLGISEALRTRKLAFTLRFTENEWPDVREFIQWAQQGIEFQWHHGGIGFASDSPPPDSFTVRLDAPRVSTVIAPTRDATVPWLLTLPISLIVSSAFGLGYFSALNTEIVAPVTVASLMISIVDTELDIDDQVQAHAFLFDDDGNVLSAERFTVAWTTTDPSVATVDSTGLITGVGSGTCTISAVSGSASDTVTITVADVAAPVLAATGGTITDIDGWRVHTFTANEDFVVTSGSTDLLDVLLVGGGGGGGHGQDRTGGGGGAGGVRRLTNQSIAPGTYAVVVGAGGAGGHTNLPATPAANGGASSFNGQSALGGGNGADFNDNSAGSGGSGGGARHASGSTAGAGTAGQGNSGGGKGFDSGSGSGVFTGSGGGGAGAAGVAGTSASGGAGGDGVQEDITGVNVYYGGGGGGSAGDYGGQSIHGGAGGQGGGGAGASGIGSVPVVGTSGTANTGGGGGAGAKASGGHGGAGGSGIVIIRYPIA